MIFHCHKCKADVSVFDNFCRRCGEETVKLTIPPNAHKPVFDEKLFCPHCAEPNLPDAVFCVSCGKGIYKAPSGTISCPKCGRKNSADSRFCTACTQDFGEWFAMKGAVADCLGLSGDISLTERMTGISYTFFAQAVVTIGRSRKSDIPIPCQWLSSRHCTIDTGRSLLLDNDSTNGVFVNRKPERVTSVPFSQIDEANFGGALTFRVSRSGELFVLRLGAVLRDDGCRQCADANACEDLRRRYLVFGQTGTLRIRKFDGEVIVPGTRGGGVQGHLDRNATATGIGVEEPYYELAVENGKYYLTDEGRGIHNELLFKDLSNLPENWKAG